MNRYPRKPLSRAQQISKWHSYLGALIAPSVLFFAATGSYQLFGWHQAHAGSAYKPPLILEQLAAVHKDQTLAVHHRAGPRDAPVKRERSAAPGPTLRGAAPGSPAAPDAGIGPLPLKGFFLGVAILLIITTCLGLWMAVKFSPSKRGLLMALAAGVVVPIALLALA